MTDQINDNSVLTVRNLTARYETRAGNVKAVNGVNFEVRKGRIVGIVGESGCGKSATIRAMLGLMARPGRVTDGSVDFQGQDLLQMKSKQLRSIRGASIGFIAQNPFGALNPILTVREQFANVVRAHRKGVSTKEINAMAHDALVDVGISAAERVLNGHAHELSGGMAQRVVIALALLLDPDLVIGDEPTTALDVTLQRQILDLIRARVITEQRSMLLVTHDLGVVAQYCDDVVVMYAGKVLERGDVKTVLRNPAHPYTKALLESVPRRGEKIKALPGRVPSLIDYPKGCPFVERCPVAIDMCRTNPPAVLPLAHDPSHSVSCHVAHMNEVKDAVTAG